MGKNVVSDRTEEFSISDSLNVLIRSPQLYSNNGCSVYVFSSLATNETSQVNFWIQTCSFLQRGGDD